MAEAGPGGKRGESSVETTLKRIRSAPGNLPTRIVDCEADWLCAGEPLAAACKRAARCRVAGGQGRGRRNTQRLDLRICAGRCTRHMPRLSARRTSGSISSMDWGRAGGARPCLFRRNVRSRHSAGSNPPRPGLCRRVALRSIRPRKCPTPYISSNTPDIAIQPAVAVVDRPAHHRKLEPTPRSNRHPSSVHHPAQHDL